MCINLTEYKKFREIVDKPERSLTPEEYEFLKSLNYPVDGLRFQVKEKVPSSV